MEEKKIKIGPYPPTHQYDPKKLSPKGCLKERVSIITNNFPNFFQGSKLLDIACSWGFFSLNSQSLFQEVVGLDVSNECINFCNHFNRYAHTKFICTSFRNFSYPYGFDKIFVGNVAHHLFLDCCGWDWLAKLYALCNGDVLIEGAVSTDCKDIAELIPDNLKSSFNCFQAEIQKYFTLKKIVKTISYTPNRYLMLYEKKIKPKYQLNTLPIKKVLSVNNFKVFLTKDNMVAKVFIRDPSGAQMWTGMTRIRLACESHLTNGMLGEIYVGNQMVGWLEKYIGGDTYRYFENEVALWNKICDHNVFLARNGYLDIDSATINFSKKTNQLFDKSCVFPIKALTDEIISLYPILFNQSYHLDKNIPIKIVEAIKTKDSKIIEKTFLELKI